MPTYNSVKETAEGRIELTIKTDGKPQTVVFLADVHNNFDYLKRVVAEIQKHPDWQVVINGDLFDADQYSSFPTSGTPLSLKDSVQETIKIMQSIFPQMIAFVWGNHEERCFKSASGKGTMPSYFDVFFQAWKAINPNAVVCELMRSLILNVNGKRVLVKHGTKAGQTFGVAEFGEVLKTNEDVDMIVLSHLHLPLHMIVKRATEGKPREVHFVRTTAGVEFLGYQDKSNFFITPIELLTRVTFGAKIKVELV